MTETVARLEGVSHRYGETDALSELSLTFPSGCMVGLIGPDGVGKSTLLGLLAGARELQTGELQVLGGDMRSQRFRNRVAPRIAYMPQGLGGNLYHTLTVDENIAFFADLFGLRGPSRKDQIDRLLEATGLLSFRDRPAGKLSGGMKQKLGLCCALIHSPDLLILDEPTTGVDPLSRKRFWDLIDTIRRQRSGMSVLVATAYMEEAERYDWLVAMDEGKVLATGSPAELREQTNTETLDDAFIALLPENRQVQESGDTANAAQREPTGENQTPAIEAEHLTLRFGSFTAVRNVSFSIPKGEIFGFLGSNGCGKTTTMKMLTGLLTPTEGEVRLFGEPLDAKDLATRQKVGYMSQAFSLYGELTVRQNLDLHARLFHLPDTRIPERISVLVREFGLEDVLDQRAGALPLGVRQRLSLAVAVVHEPELLILDEPTSGVDPGARNRFWQLLMRLSREDGVTIFISTHFMNEAERCDRVSLMHAGRVLATDTPSGLAASCGADTLEDAFIRYLEDASDADAAPSGAAIQASGAGAAERSAATLHAPRPFSARRAASYAQRESLELLRDPMRLALSLIGSVLLLIVMGYGISMDVEDLTFAVLDRDGTTTSRDYALNISGSRYFIERPPLRDYADLDRRMRDGRISLAVEIPPGFARDIARGRPVEIGAWVDGAMPSRAETARAYVEGMHASWLAARAREAGRPGAYATPASIVVRFRYNPELESAVAMVPAIIPLLLMMIPSMFAALGVVREKELGSITNLYATPTTRLEFLVGKQVPYIVISMISFLILVAVSLTLFAVPFKGSFLTLSVAALLYVTAATAIGLLISTFMRSQIAAIFGTAILTTLPAISFSGLLNPVSSLEGVGRVIGALWPTTHFLTIARGTFSKALGFTDVTASFVPLLIAIPIVLGLAALRLPQQET